MTDTKSLKQKNVWLVRGSLVVHGLLFAYLVTQPIEWAGIGGEELFQRLQGLAAPSASLLALMAISTLILLGIIPANWRDRLIHLRWRNPLPITRAFTIIGPNCSRVDMAELERRVGTLPTDPGKQGKLFYRIYGEYRNEVGVLDAYRSYLATREIGTINAIFMFTAPLIAFWATGNVRLAAVYFLILVGAYLLCCIAAKNYAARMVENVLSYACSRPHVPNG